MYTLLFSIIILIIAVLGLCVGIFFSKKKKFPETEIMKNKEMQKLNITCAKYDEYTKCKKNKSCNTCCNSL